MCVAQGKKYEPPVDSGKGLAGLAGKVGGPKAVAVIAITKDLAESVDLMKDLMEDMQRIQVGDSDYKLRRLIDIMTTIKKAVSLSIHVSEQIEIISGESNAAQQQKM